MRIYRIILIIIVSCAAQPLNAQDQPVRIRIANESHQPIHAAIISLSTGAEPAIKRATDSTGQETFMLRPLINYIADVSAKGYLPFTTTIIADSTHFDFPFILLRGQALREAVVKASKPLMRQDGDVTILDPEQLVAASTSGYEVLEKTPGIVADQEGNFFMTSSTPASIYINGREMKMSAADIAAMLKSLPPNSIQRIEIIRTPSAKFDASGSGGIINIVLKKGVKLGLTGSANIGAQQGVYGNQNAGLNLSYNDGDRSAYLNLNAANRKSLEHTVSTRILSVDSQLSQDAGSINSSKNFFMGYGLGKTFLKGKLDISYDGRIALNYPGNTLDNRSSIISDVGGLGTDNITATGSNSRSWNIDQSIDAKYKIDTSGSEWTGSLSWNGNFGKINQDILSRFLQPAYGDIINNGEVQTRRFYSSLQSDLKYKLPKKLVLEAGLKSTLTTFRHESDFNIRYNGISAADPLRTTTYRYTENINALYAQVSKTIGDLIIKPGLRMETTLMEGDQTRPGDTSFSIRRADLFPYFYISHPVIKMLGFELRAYLIYRRTITRPAYDYLNPFQRFVDQYLYEAGNPSLRPQFMNNYEFNISAGEHPVLVVGYNDVKDVFSQVIYESDVNSSIALRTWDNLGSNKEFYLRGMGGVPPGGSYFFIFGGQYNLNMYDGVYNGAPLKYQRESFTFFTYHNLKLGKKMNIVVNGFMRLKGFLQFYELGTFGALNASINRQFLDKKLQVTLSAQDIFFTNRYDATIDQGGITGTVSRYNDSQRFGINLRYNFGIKPKEEKKGMFGEGEKEDGQ